MPDPWGELKLIDSIRAASPTRHSVVLGIGDDCALLRFPIGSEIAVTTDMLLEDKHFRRDLHPAESAGHRALARGLSDLAAMGAQPLAAFLSLALPPNMLAKPLGRAWVKGFFKGLHRLGGQFGVTLAGGDTAGSPTGLILADITLIGAAPRGKALRRSTARPGDILYVTGALGGSAAELASLIRHSHPGKAPRRIAVPAGHPQLFPEPRIAVGLALLRRKLATAAIDISDGLSTDLTHLCRESGLSAEIDQASLPIHPLASRSHESHDPLDLALNGGEDYELLFSAAAKTKVPRRIAGVAITPIGRLMPASTALKNRISLMDTAGRRRSVRPGGWEHLTSRR